MNIDLTPIFQAIIMLAAGLITYKLVPWIKSKTTQQQQQNIQAAYRIFIMAAEQIYGANHGPEKLQYVVDGLRARGYDVDVPTIEALVMELFNYDPFGAIGETEDGKREAE
ncbi:MAG: phage holin family protein [Clostridiales bacterium]|nr:phage holin family protein [Clostridiales bacterium]